MRQPLALTFFDGLKPGFEQLRFERIEDAEPLLDDPIARVGAPRTLGCGHQKRTNKISASGSTGLAKVAADPLDDVFGIRTVEPHGLDFQGLCAKLQRAGNDRHAVFLRGVRGVDDRSQRQ